MEGKGDRGSSHNDLGNNGSSKGTPGRAGLAGGQYLGLTGQLEFSAGRHAIRAASIRYFLATGKVPQELCLINEVVGTNSNGFMRSLRENDYIPKSIYAARDAGLSFVGA